MSKVTAEQQEAWNEIVKKKYADQAVWFLNGFWEEVQPHAEDVWKWAELFAELDQENKAEGSELDEFWSHKFLERLGETMTVIEMREKFRTIDVDFNKRMSLTEFLAYRFKKTIQEVIDAPQGGNQEEINKAQAAVDAAQKAVDEMVARLAEATRTADEAAAAAAEAKRTADEAKAAADEATRTANEAKAASDAAEEAAAPYRAAVAENEKALEELHAQEKAFNDKKEALEKTKNDESIGVVKRNKAANELDQLLSEDPLPLRKAKINQAATVRKMEKAAKPFNEASEKAKAAAEVAEAAAAEATAAANHARAEREKADAAKAAADATAAAAEAAKQQADAAAAAAEEAKQQADAAAAAAEEAKQQAEEAVKEAESMLQNAMDALEAAKKKGGVARGAIWWMERALEEKKKYMPGYKGPRK